MNINKAVIFSALLVISSCAPFGIPLLAMETNPLEDKDLRIISFNVQNLFDGIDDNEEYPDYVPPSWTNKEYEKRLVAIGKALQSLDFHPNIIALQEVENNRVVIDLQKYYLSHLPYVAVSDNPDSATENALLSRYEIVSMNTHTIHESYYRGNRYILDVTINIEDSAIEHAIPCQLIVVHLKSKLASSSAFSSDEIRAKQYELIMNIENQNIPTIVLGDFNDEDPLDSMGVSQFVEYDFASYAPNTNVGGTYYYRSQWQQLDHILLDTAFDSMVNNEQSYVIDVVPFYSTKYKSPNRFIKRLKNFDAISDHLPILFAADFVRE